MNIPLIKPYINQEIKNEILEVLDSGYLTEGSVTRFDDIFITGVANSASAKVEGTPDVVRGTVSVGFKF